MDSMYKLVEGTYDYLPQSCFSLDCLKESLLKSFTLRGFKKIQTPMIERYDLFAKGFWKVDTNKLFKFTDSDGSLLVLRPDMTMPIARIINTKQKDIKAAKYCYIGNSFCYQKSNNSMREFTQAGVEIIGKNTIYVDADIITLAICSLLKAGLNSFQIDIGHVGYFKGFLKALNLNEQEERDLINLVEAKDSFGIELFAKNHSITKDKLEGIFNLPTLFGGNEVLEYAKNYCACEEAESAIRDLSDIYNTLKSLGYEKYISFDLSLVNGFGYYSGVVFKGITRYFGAPILSGGRYDNLSKNFNNNIPATGFAIGVNNLLIAITNQSGEDIKLPANEVLIGGACKNANIIHGYINALVENGHTVENSYIESIDEFLNYFKDLGVAKGVFVNPDGSFTEVENG